MSKKNETPDTTAATTGPGKRISLRKEKVKSLSVQSGVHGGALVTVIGCTLPGGKGGPGGCERSLIICAVSDMP